MKGLKESTAFSEFLSSFLNIHSHRYYRRFFCCLILCHIITVLLPYSERAVFVPPSFQYVLSFMYEMWPFPTFNFSNFGGDQGMGIIFLRNIVFKSFEIQVILLYVIDLLPKIFVWKKSLLWKTINAVIVTIMVAQVPLTLIGYLAEGDVMLLKVRTGSIGLSFLLLLEIMSIREQRLLLISKTKRKLSLSSKVKLSPLQQYFQEKNEKESLGLRQYTWPEIIQHDKPGDCWIVIHGKVYDVTNFVDHHPGGSMIYDGAGGDCTAMFESYHPLALTKSGPPEKYLIGEVRDYTDFYSWDGEFYDKLKAKVEKALPHDKRRNSSSLFSKGFVIIIGYWIGMYCYIKYNNIWATLLFSFFGSQVGVNVMHDGNHGAYSTSRFLSWIAGASLDFTGSTSVVYKRSHNFGHHGCVNHLELDRSFDTTFPLFRLHKLQPKMWIHSYQHIYIWLIYGMVNFGDLFGTFDELAWMSNYPTRRGHVSRAVYWTHAFVKFYWIMFDLVIPSYIHGFCHAFPYWVMHMVVFAYGYALFFAVNHWTTEAAQVDNTSVGRDNWGVLQVENSSNFAIGSKFWTHISGGLNYQIEHHLFPGYAHTNLPEISEIVQEACKENKIRYYSFDSFWSALAGHYRHLRSLAMED
eukprot:CAMPEP_0176452368 /NCGR_PEP_ID=MMETSP0127-20121128/28493_1 /TAXON_ID=938130 /ORGANISM="Platyophrya macrostoma, Strain WH" /LENGTH=634 /DNA_ID=CAMNT_0017840807 /DNA_START=67 /DNA_END=1971 /DNA_ORIENTATION=+